jgi:hypothetical protein
MLTALEALALTLKNLDCRVKLQVSHIFINELHRQVWAERHRAKTVVPSLAGDTSEVTLALVTVNLWKLSYPELVGTRLRLQPISHKRLRFQHKPGHQKMSWKIQEQRSIQPQPPRARRADVWCPYACWPETRRV